MHGSVERRAGAHASFRPRCAVGYGAAISVEVALPRLKCSRATDSLPYQICFRAVYMLGAEMGRVSMATRDELVVAVAEHYEKSLRAERGRILDEFTGYDGVAPQARDAAATGGSGSGFSGLRPGRRIYDEATRATLIDA